CVRCFARQSTRASDLRLKNFFSAWYSKRAVTLRRILSVWVFERAGILACNSKQASREVFVRARSGRLCWPNAPPTVGVRSLSSSRCAKSYRDRRVTVFRLTDRVRKLIRRGSKRWAAAAVRGRGRRADAPRRKDDCRAGQAVHPSRAAGGSIPAPTARSLKLFRAPPGSRLCCHTTDSRAASDQTIPDPAAPGSPSIANF